MSNTARKFYAAPSRHDSCLSLEPVNSDTATVQGSSNVLTISLVLISLQVLDGFLTLSGTVTFGLSAEGNPLLRELMHSIGLIPALILTKLGCIALIVLLSLQASRVVWLPRALTAVAGVYAIAAIVPWSIILLTEYLG
jgi:hypothetical protein